MITRGLNTNSSPGKRGIALEEVTRSRGKMTPGANILELHENVTSSGIARPSPTLTNEAANEAAHEHKQTK